MTKPRNAPAARDTKHRDALQALVINALSQHLGRANGVRADVLAQRLGMSPRNLRCVISQLRNEAGRPICGRPATGYFIAVTPEELRDACAFLRRRAMHSLRLLRQMRRTSMPTLMGQLNLNQA